MGKRFRKNKKKARSEENPEVRYLKLVGWAFVGIFALAAIGAASALLLTLEGPEETKVPQVQGEDLIDALLSLQERGLNSRIQLRYYSDPTMKGRVIGQDPEAGAYVRAGRSVSLTVSQGAIIDEVGDYRGQLLTDVQTEFQTMFSSFEQLLNIQSVNYVFDDSPVGTIIEQEPEPGTKISGPTGLVLLVSRGPDVEQFSLPTFIGLSWEDAMTVLSRDNVPFVFSLEEQPTIGQEGVVVSQSPEPGTQVKVGTPVQLAIRDVRDVPLDFQFGIFDRVLPEYAVSVELSAVAVGPEGDSKTLFSMDHPGGEISFPYLLEIGSTIVLYRYDTEVIRFVIREEESDE